MYKVNKTICCVTELMDHVIEESIKIYADTDQRDTFLIFAMVYLHGGKVKLKLTLLNKDLHIGSCVLSVILMLELVIQRSSLAIVQNCVLH